MNEDSSTNARRRAIVLALGSLSLPFGTLALSSCGGGGPDSTSATGGQPSGGGSTSSPAATKATDIEVAFSADPMDRLLFLSNAAGYGLRYYGPSDATGQPTAITSVVFETPDASADAFTCQLGDPLTVTMTNGDLMTVSGTPNGDYQITLLYAAGATSYSTTLSALHARSGSPSKASTTISPTTRSATLADTKAAATAVAASDVAVARSLATGTQDISVTVTDKCNAQVTLGTVFVKVTPNSDLAQQSLLGKILFPPPVDLKLKLNPNTNAFEGSVPLTQLQSKLQVMTSDAAAVEEDIIKSLLAALKIGGVMAEALLLLPSVLSQNNTSLSDALSLLAKRIGGAWSLINAVKSAASNGVKLFGNITDLYQVIKTADSATNRFPILVTAYWAGGTSAASGTTIVDYPGQTVASISLPGETSKMFVPQMSPIVVQLLPNKQQYSVTVEIPNACLAPAAYYVDVQAESDAGAVGGKLGPVISPFQAIIPVRDAASLALTNKDIVFVSIWDGVGNVLAWQEISVLFTTNGIQTAPVQFDCPPGALCLPY